MARYLSEIGFTSLTQGSAIPGLGLDIVLARREVALGRVCRGE
jgi:hypothetical protein